MAAIMQVENPGNLRMETRLSFGIGIGLDLWRYVTLVRTSRRAGGRYDAVLSAKRKESFDLKCSKSRLEHLRWCRMVYMVGDRCCHNIVKNGHFEHSIVMWNQVAVRVEDV